MLASVSLLEGAFEGAFAVVSVAATAPVVVVSRALAVSLRALQPPATSASARATPGTPFRNLVSIESSLAMVRPRLD